MSRDDDIARWMAENLTRSQIVGIRYVARTAFWTILLIAVLMVFR